jgi:DNA invertase Pin-like site-specific DNA recombinase
MSASETEEKTEMADTRTPCVIYAAKSTQDKHLSIPDQIRDCEKKAEEEGWEVVAVGPRFTDENFSAYSGNRGPGLVRSQEAAAAVAAERGVPCMLVAQHSDRFARGAGDKPGASDSLVEVWTRARRSDVHLRSFQNDSMMADIVLVAVASKQAHEESKRKSEAIKGGKRRRTEERGQTNGPLAFGYRFEDPDAKDKVRVPDPEESAAWLRAREMLREGKGLAQISRWLFSAGHKSKQGNPIAPARVKYMLANPYYAGKVKVPGTDELVDGAHEALTTWDDHLQVVRELGERSAASRPGRRPARPSLLSGVMRCAHCGQGIWERRHPDGPWRSYSCRSHRLGLDPCGAVSFKAAPVEQAVLDHLDGLFVDLGGWIEGLAADREEGQRAAEREAADLMGEREGAERKIAALEADYVERTGEGDRAAAGVAARQVARLEAERDGLAASLAGVQARLAEWDGGADADSILDWWTDFSAAIRGEVLDAPTVAEANAALRERFAAIFVRSPEGGSPRLDFVLADRPPGAPLVSSRLWADNEVPDDGSVLVDFISNQDQEGQAGDIEPLTLV